MKILVLGVTGMLGSMVFRLFSNSPGYVAWGTMRSHSALKLFSHQEQSRIISGVDVLDLDSLLRVYGEVRPDVVINCIGITNKREEMENSFLVIQINSLLPHRLASICEVAGARLVHISTDCVFSGVKGGYKESDSANADHLYGQSKRLGEIDGKAHVITLRTSIVGHGLVPNESLVDWFLAQKGSVKGYKRAIFSGLPTMELARVIRDFVIPDRELYGLYHVAAEPIDKFSLLSMVRLKYSKDIEIIPDEEFVIDRSLDSARFREATGYTAPEWEKLVDILYQSYELGSGNVPK